MRERIELSGETEIERKGITYQVEYSIDRLVWHEPQTWETPAETDIIKETIELKVSYFDDDNEQIFLTDAECQEFKSEISEKVQY